MSLAKMNLKTKAAVFVALILIVVIGLSTAIVSSEMNKHLEDALLSSATLVGKNVISDIKKTIDMGIYLSELDGLSDQLTLILQKYPDLGYILVTDSSNGLLYFSEGMAEWVKEHVVVDGKEFADDADRSVVKVINSGKTGFYHLTQAIVSADVVEGYLAVGLKEDVVSVQLKRINRKMLTTGMISFIVATLLIVIFVNKLISIPLVNLALIANKISDGHLVEPSDLDRSDEIGELASAFGIMVRELTGMIGRFSETSNSLQSSSEELASTASNLSNSFKSQVDTLDGVVGSIQEMDTLSQNLSGQALSLSDSANESASSIMESTTAIGEINQNMAEINDSIENITSSILQMSATFSELAEGADETANLAEETMSAVARINEGVKNMEGMADQSRGLADELKVNAKDIGVNAVNATLQGILSIKEDVTNSEQAMKSLNDRVDNIGEIVTVIEGIADQTNLLALNAAIISAQAGEEGKSFAVVASEIRELSASTTESTKKISSLIRSVQKETKDYSNYVKRVSKSVDEGHELGQQASAALENIVLAASDSAQMSEQMVLVTKEQASASELVSNSIQHFTERADIIRRATSEEAQTAKFIRDSIENAKKMVEKVYRATEEQNKTAQMINETVMQAEETAGNLHKAMERERNLSSNIARSVNDLKTMSHGNFEMVKSVDSSSVMLTDISTSLKKELERFKGSD